MMTWIELLEKANQDFYKDSFNKIDLSRYKEGNEPGKGSAFKYKNNFFRVQIFSDGKEIEAQISPLFGEEQFRGIDKYNALINSNGAKLDHKAQAAFLVNNFEKLKTLLDKNNYQETLKKVDSAK
jgi:hypothetical protein